MKTKIVFMVINMNVGGTEKALLNMISELPRERFDITLLMLEKKGGFLNSIPEHVHVKYIKQYKTVKELVNSSPYKIIVKYLKSGNLLKAFSIAALNLLTKVMKEKSLFYKYILKEIPSIETKYDIAVAYAGPMDLISYFVLNKVSARKKVQWIHFDIDKIGFNKYFAAKLYEKFDKIFVVSNEARERLLRQLPILRNKTEVFSNVISSRMIAEEAKDGSGFRDDFNGVRVLTVGRLSDEKGQDMAIRALSRLIHDGFDIRWYCIGEGNSRKKYEALRDELHLTDRFIMLGEETNPYHYIKHCDVYVQPSRHEGYCITLAEARALQKPIITTSFTGAKEQIKDGKTGLIIGIDDNQIYLAVKELLNNPNLCSEFRKNLSEDLSENWFEIEKIYNLV